MVGDLLKVCGEERAIRTADALERLKQIDDAPWRNYAGEGLTDIKLAELVRPFGIAPKLHKLQGKPGRGYLRKDLEAALNRVQQGEGDL